MTVVSMQNVVLVSSLFLHPLNLVPQNQVRCCLGHSDPLWPPQSCKHPPCGPSSPPPAIPAHHRPLHLHAPQLPAVLHLHARHYLLGCLLDLRLRQQVSPPRHLVSQPVTPGDVPKHQHQSTVQQQERACLSGAFLGKGHAADPGSGSDRPSLPPCLKFRLALAARCCLNGM